MNEQQWLETLNQQHQHAINVACAMPAPLAEETRQAITASRDKATSFDTLKTALQHIAKRIPASLPVLS